MKKSLWILPLIVFATVLADQITKQIALDNLEYGQPVPVIGDYLRWTLVFNPGGAFSINLGSPIYYQTMALLIFIFLLYYIFRHRHTMYISIPLSFVAGGALGNIIDRFRFGEVVDFIDCEFPDISILGYHMERWPIFNIADMGVSVGIIATIISIYFFSHHEPHNEEVADNESS